MRDFEDILTQYKELLKKNELKYTHQREVVLKTLFDNVDTHFTPEDLYLLIKHNNPDLNIGIATIYRTLGLLEKADFVNSISFGVSGKKYEFGTQIHHDHLICSNCGAIVEFVDEEIEERQQKIANKYGYIIKEHVLQIFGICPTCQTKLNKKDSF